MAYKRQKQYRLPGHTYAEPGSYFITICVKGRNPVFGEVCRENGRAVMNLSEAGKALASEIVLLESKYPHLRLGKWQIMPDHVHLILHLNNNLARTEENGHIADLHENTPSPRVNENAPRRVPTCPTGIQPLNTGSISSVGNHLKGNLTKWAKANNTDLCWQPRFFDRITRDMAELTQIEHYIVNNPERWLHNRYQLTPNLG